MTAPAWGALQTELRRADAHGHDVEHLLPRLTDRLAEADDPAAVLHHRLTRAAARRRPEYQPQLIAGLLPKATGSMSADMRTALQARTELIEQHAAALAEAAVRDREPWVQQLGSPPTDPTDRKQWLRAVQAVAVHRVLSEITDPEDSGATASSATTAIARTAISHAQTASRTSTSTVARGGPSRTLGF